MGIYLQKMFEYFKKVQEVSAERKKEIAREKERVEGERQEAAIAREKERAERERQEAAIVKIARQAGMSEREIELEDGWEQVRNREEERKIIRQRELKERSKETKEERAIRERKEVEIAKSKRAEREEIAIRKRKDVEMAQIKKLEEIAKETKEERAEREAREERSSREWKESERVKRERNTVFNSFNPIEGGETTLYYLRLVFKGKKYYKIGITFHSVQDRYKGNDFKIIDKILYEKKLTHAKTIEQQIINYFKEHSFPLAILSSGQTEIFDIDVLKLDV